MNTASQAVISCDLPCTLSYLHLEPQALHCYLSTCKHAFIVPGCNRVAWDEKAGLQECCRELNMGQPVIHPCAAMTFLAYLGLKSLLE